MVEAEREVLFVVLVFVGGLLLVVEVTEEGRAEEGRWVGLDILGVVRLVLGSA